MTAAALLEERLIQFKNDIECILENSKFTREDDFFKNICAACQNCDAGNKSYADTLSHLHDLILALLSKRILILDQQLIATKAFLFIQNYFFDNHEHLVDFIIQLTLLNETNKTLVYSLRSTPVNETKFSSCEEISLFKTCFYYHFSNLLKEQPLLSALCARSESRALLLQIVNFCKLQNDLTSIAFKTLVNFLSSFSQYDDDFFSEDLLVSILNLILANWENPIPGVKENNLILFRLFLSIKNNNLNVDFSTIVYEDLSWNMKSKYLMLMEILNLNKDSVQTLEEKYPDLIPKLIDGMKINYLVSACTELYLFITGCIDFERWRSIFFDRLISVLSTNHGNESQKWNILSHWMIKTLKKFPKSIESILLALREKKNNQAVPCDTFLAVIMCLKILRKQGIKNYKEFDDFKEWETIVQDGLQHINERIRCESFNLICNCTKTTVQPTKTECLLVLRFIVENINFDSSYVRQNVITSTVIFLERLSRSSTSQLKKAETARDFQNSDTHWFLKTLIAFLSQNLTAGSNYQRQITSLKLLKILAEECLSQDCFKLIVEYLTEKSFLKQLFDCILCEIEDVNEAAAQIIILYIQNGFHVPNNHKISDCLSKIHSDRLHRFASNEILLKVCLIEEVKNVEVQSRTVPLSSVVLVPLLDSIQDQVKILFEDNLKVASTGALFCSLKAITHLISSKETSVLLDFNHPFCSKLLMAMEQIVQHLLKSLTSEQTDDIDFAPSFAEMGLAIEKQIQSSTLHNAFEKTENGNGILLSSAYQSLLCCIWRNLQACCDLAVSLSLAYSEDLTEEEVLRCGKLISDVLTQCRHKGAIEAAGVALGRFISFIIKKNNERYIDWIDELLAKVFKLLTSEGSKTISRRSAGLSILIHRLAINDTRHYHTVIGKIVPVLLDIAEVPFKENDLVLKDLPQAQALHLLCKIVEDSSLRLSVAPFLKRIVLVLCSSIASPAWGIRNAALQLCGAVILKILGRNKTQETECLVNTSYEQLFSHHEYLKNIFLRCTLNPGEEHPDKIIFLLTILSHTSIQTDAAVTRSESDYRFLLSLRMFTYMFISNKNYEIRRLAAVSYVNLFPKSRFVSMANTSVYSIFAELGLELNPAVKKIKEEMKDKLDKRTDGLHRENFIHGCLLVVKFIVVKFKKENGTCGDQFSVFRLIYNLINLSGPDLCSFLETLKISAPPESITLSFPVKTLIYEICYLLDFNCCANGKTDQFLESEIRAFTKFIHSHDAHDVKNFGVSGFAEMTLKCLVARHEPQHMGKVFWFCSMNYSYNLLDVCLKEMKLDEDSATEMLARCFKFLSVGFFAGDIESRVINLTVIEFVISVLDRYRSNLIGKVDASLDNIDSFSSNFIQTDSEFMSKAILVSAAFLYLRCKNSDDDLALLKKILSGLMSHIPKLRTSNFEEARLNIAKSLYYLTNLVSPDDQAVCVIWESIICLLQDEEFIIRREVSEVVSAIEKKSFVLNPFVALSTIIQPSVMLKIMEPELLIGSCWAQCILSKTNFDNLCLPDKSGGTDLICNPYNYTHYNFFSEDAVVLKAIFSNLCIFLRDCLGLECTDEINSFSPVWQYGVIEPTSLLSPETKLNLKRIVSQHCEISKEDFKVLVTKISTSNLKSSSSLSLLHLRSHLSSSLMFTLQSSDNVKENIKNLENALLSLKL